MSDQRLLDENQLRKFGFTGGSIGERSEALLKHQLETWPMLQKGASSLDSVLVREVDFDGFSLKIQFNPGRIVSSAAKVDKKSIAERKCFLCTDNLPPEQKGVRTGNYTILANPFPIFREHFTIPHEEHIPQEIKSSFPAMLDIQRSMGERYSLFYNGPRCGASAPDHLHFQAGEFGFMTIDKTWKNLVEKHGWWIREENGIRLENIAAVDDGLRKFIIIETPEKNNAINCFNLLYDAFNKHNPEPDEEPMLNVLTAWQGEKWRIIAFLRRKHRPTQFFLEGDKKIVFSPASVDLGGVCITPVEADFKRLTRSDLEDMFGQLSVTRDVLDDVANALK